MLGFSPIAGQAAATKTAANRMPKIVFAIPSKEDRLISKVAQLLEGRLYRSCDDYLDRSDAIGLAKECLAIMRAETS